MFFKPLIIISNPWFSEETAFHSDALDKLYPSYDGCRKSIKHLMANIYVQFHVVSFNDKVIEML